MIKNTASTKNVVLTVMNKTVLIENDAKRSFHKKNVVIAVDLEQQQQQSLFVLLLHI